jgi:hypothetical protein
LTSFALRRFSWAAARVLAAACLFSVAASTPLSRAVRNFSDSAIAAETDTAGHSPIFA